MTGHDVIDLVLERVRDPGSHIHARAKVLDLIWRCQQVWNAWRGRVRGSQTFALNPRNLTYRISEVLPSCALLIELRVDGRWLEPVEFAELEAIDTYWLRRTADEAPQCWAPLERDLLVVYPAPNFAATAEAVYVTITPRIDSEDDSLVLPEEEIPGLVDLVEAFLLARERRWERTEAALERIRGKRDAQG